MGGKLWYSKAVAVVKCKAEILIRRDGRQISFLSASMVYTTSLEMKSKWANLKVSRLVEERCKQIISLVILPSALQAFAFK